MLDGVPCISSIKPWATVKIEIVLYHEFAETDWNMSLDYAFIYDSGGNELDQIVEAEILKIYQIDYITSRGEVYCSY